MRQSFPTPAWRRWLLAGGMAAAAAGTAVLFFFDPARCAIYPVCPWHTLTGWECPGCGALRAIHQLTHGNWAAAWRLNPLTVALLPVAGWLGLREGVWQVYGKKWPGLVTRPCFGWALVVILVLFGIVRNLPGFHF
ncbi:MAG: DUF2752 domain-containing protein [Verrucomicrobiota bacterium]